MTLRWEGPLTHKASRIVLFVALSGLFRAEIGAAQTQAPSDQKAEGSAQPAPRSNVETPSTALRVSSNLVLVDVVVTDHGQPVHGLGRGDFKVFEDGQERPIVSFEEHRPDGPAPDVQSVAAQAAAVQAALPRGGYTNLPVYPQASAVNVLLLDELNTPPAALPELRREMIQYLAGVQPGTSMAIFVLTSQLRMVTGFTTDVSQFAPLFDDRKTAAHSANSTGPAAKTNLALITQKETDKSDREALQGGPAGPGLEAMMGPIAAGQLNDSLGQQQEVRINDTVATTLGAFRQLARYLSAIPGRKNLIWLSASFPNWLGLGKSNYEPAIRATMNLLAAARVAVYPVDAAGLTIGSHWTPQRETMQMTAELTGGKAYLDTNGFKDAMADAVVEGSSYYTIGYLPGDKPFNGNFRKIKVDIDKGHFTLNYRNGYYADPPNEPSAHTPETANLITEATLHGTPPMTQVLLVAQVLPASDPAFKNLKFKKGSAGDMAATMKQPAQLYVVNLTVDPHGVAFDAMPNGLRQARIRFVLIAYDTNGNRLNFLDRNYAIGVKPAEMERLMNTGIHARYGFNLPAGHEFLRVAVEDLNAGTAGSVEIPVTVDELTH